MPVYKADLHIHTVLSPCGGLEMSPANIVNEASKKGLNIIGITDHNSTRQAPLIKELGNEKGLFVLCGAEITTKEETHCLAFMPDDVSLQIFQKYLDTHLPNIANDENEFGFQVCVDRDEQIVFQEQRLLWSALDQSIDQIEQQVHALGGIFIPAHINRPRYSLISQLGFVPPDLKADALELSKHISVSDFLNENSYLSHFSFLQNSDAHFLNDIGSTFTLLEMNHLAFSEVKQSLNKLKNRI